MFVRAVLFFLLAALAMSASAQAIPALRWNDRSQFEFVFDGGEVSGALSELGEARMGVDRYTVEIKAYRGFVSVILTQDGKQEGELWIFERRNGAYHALNKSPILGRRRPCRKTCRIR
ncbi:MAG: hypothetical protein HC902_07250 [Calothrix sp. SM1_5_4]|nr:hypothetical protein [Calothrix sp. SM1_5_4]